MNKPKKIKNNKEFRESVKRFNEKNKHSCIIYDEASIMNLDKSISKDLNDWLNRNNEVMFSNLNQKDKEILYLRKELEYLQKCNKTFSNDARIVSLAKELILNLFKAEKSPHRFGAVDYKPRCLNCNERLIEGRNVRLGYHINLCKDCRLKVMELVK